MLPPHAIGNDIRRNDELTRSWPLTWPAQLRELRQMLHTAQQMSCDPLRGVRVVLLDVMLNFREIRDGLCGPAYSHSGGGSLRFLPQDSR